MKLDLFVVDAEIAVNVTLHPAVLIDRPILFGEHLVLIPLLEASHVIVGQLTRAVPLAPLQGATVGRFVAADVTEVGLTLEGGYGAV
jgi:hypothetical protein